MSARSLYIFNPDHDLALANGNENFFPLQLARYFAIDCGCLPLWYAEPGSIVKADIPEDGWLKGMKACFPQLKNMSIEPQTGNSNFEKVCPWGWNPSIRKKLLSEGVSADRMPDNELLANIRRLSHRSIAIEAMQFLHFDKELSLLLPPPAKQLTADEVDGYVKQYSHTILKSPWSGSGRGLFWIKGSLSRNAKDWCHRVVKKQGVIIGEPVYDKVLDFATEWNCNIGKASFIGYSLFETESQGIYKGNYLLGDKAILDKISSYIPLEVLLKVQLQMQLFLEKEIAPFYNGYLGVDMLIYRDGKRYSLHPCVEINLRMTMGLVAWSFYHNFVHPRSAGYFHIDYSPSSEKLFNDHNHQIGFHPLIVREGKITAGYLSLSPVTTHSHFRARIEIDP